MNRFQKLAIAALASTYALIGVGGLVRASGSGAGCGSSWPFCNGVPGGPFSYHALIEQSHRLFALISVVLVGWLAVVAWRRYRRDPRLFRGSMLAAVLVVAQAALGAVVVKGDLKASLVTAHFATAMLLAGTLVYVVASSFCNVRIEERGTARVGHEPGFAHLAVATAAATFLLLIVGAYVRGQGAGLAFPDWPLMDGKLVPQLGGVATTMFLHRVLAALVGVLVVYVVLRAWTMPRRFFDLTFFSTLTVVLFLAQVLLGAALVWTKLSAPAKVAHVVVSSLIWGALVALATTSRRLVGTKRAAAEVNGQRAGEPVGTRRSLGQTTRAYFQLTKPRIVVLLLITTVPTMVLAAGGFPSAWLIAATLFGGTLAAGGANAMNQFFDRDIDQLMRRTRSRPLPSHRIEPNRALGFGYALGAIAFVFLGMTVNVLAAALALSALLFYVVVYTLLLKRTTPQNIVIGGAAGAVPVLVGWAAVRGSLGLPPLILFAIVFMWTPPHFWALSMRYQTDYAAAGVPMLPVVRGERATTRSILLYTIVLVGVTLVLYPVARMGAIYLVAALALGGVFLYRAVELWRNTSPKLAFGLFKYSITYLALLFAAVAADRLIAIPT
ncbi:MAG: heme o synthase [Actinomycetota bacterium]|nr:heme o synthase [Actinomycetota bacterium]